MLPGYYQEASFFFLLPLQPVLQCPVHILYLLHMFLRLSLFTTTYWSSHIFRLLSLYAYWRHLAKVQIVQISWQRWRGPQICSSRNSFLFFQPWVELHWRISIFHIYRWILLHYTPTAQKHLLNSSDKWHLALFPYSTITKNIYLSKSWMQCCLERQPTICI